MRSFQDLYKDKFASQPKVTKSTGADYEILDNPILAFVSGISEDRIRQVLSRDGWNASEIGALLSEARQARDLARKQTN